MTFQDPNLAALILCGGKSIRMGKDKYEMNYHGVPQWLYLYQLMQRLHLKVYLSCNSLQADKFDNSFSKIIDSIEAKGPAVGLLSAYQFLPQYSWIVIACDTPLINETTITKLIEEREKNAIATCYKNPENNLPEPLIALWEKDGLKLLKEQASKGVFCPRKLLINQNAKLINPNFNMELYNANTKEDYHIIKNWIVQQQSK